MNDLHRPQRAMRRRLAMARQEGTAAVLDIGTSKVSCAIVRFQSDIDQEGMLQSHIEVLGAGQTMSLGVECGDIAEPPETTAAIRSAVTKAQAMAKLPADLAVACLSASYPESGLFVGSTALRSGAVEETDVSRSLAACNTPELKPGRETLHAFPVYFGVDQRKELADPRGQIGNRLYATLHVVSVDRAPLEVAAGCLRNCHLRIAGLVSTAYASGLACLTEDEQEIGAACLDIGAGTTDIAVFRKKHMVATDTIRIGGDHVTSDISEAFGISRQEAEGIKLRHGGAVAGSRDNVHKITLGKKNGALSDSREISRAALIGIIRPRMIEILEESLHGLDQVGMSNAQGGRIVLTGGCAACPGFELLAREIFGDRVRFSRPMHVSRMPAAMATAPFSSLIGTCLHTVGPQDEWWDFPLPKEHRSGFFGYLMGWIANKW